MSPTHCCPARRMRTSHAVVLKRLVTLVMIAGGATSGLAAQHGRFLPGTFPDSNILGWGRGTNDPNMFVAEVVDPLRGTRAGDLHFDSDKFVSLPDLDQDTGPPGGAALSGGFYMDDDVLVKDGFELHWVQTIVATKTGENVWNLPTSSAGRFPDVKDPAAPIYSEESLHEKVTPPDPLKNPTLAFRDFPERFFEAGGQEWNAELGLVAISKTANLKIDNMDFHEVRVVGSFGWAFKFPDPNAPFDTDDITYKEPFGWGAASANYVNTLNAFYDGLGGGGGSANNGAGVTSGKYKFVTGKMVFVPEPASGLLGALVLVIGSIRRSR